MTYLTLTVIAILFIIFVAISAVSSAIELSVVSMSRLRARSLFKQSKPGAEALVRLKDNPRRLLITVSVWNNTSSVAAASLATVFFTELLGPNGVGISVVLVTLILLLFGDIGPKLSASGNSDAFALRFAPYVEWVVKLSSPIVVPVDHVTRQFSKHSTERSGKRPIITEEDLDSILSVAVDEGTIGSNEAKLVRDALDFNDQIVEKVMTKAEVVEFFQSSMTVSQALVKSSVSRHHRFPVKDDDGKVIGLVHEKLLLDASSKGRGDASVTAVMLSPLFVRKHVPISQVFELFQKRKRKMAVVLDDSGSAVGLISLEDIVEELIDELRNIEVEPVTSVSSKDFIG